MKPTKPIRSIFLLTVFKTLLAGVFFAIFTLKGADPEKTFLIGMTAGAYLLLAIPTFVSIHHFGPKSVRFFIVLALIAGIPAKAFIAIAIDLIALWLSFRPSAVAYLTAARRHQAQEVGA